MKPIARISGDGPWCWQSKAARRRIREAFDSTHNVATALSVYDALTEIASDGADETFTTTHAWIQRISGVSVRTIQNHLNVFAELGLLTISTPRLRAPSTYTLLSFGSDCGTFGSGSASNGNQCATFGNDQFRPPLPTSEEREKKDQKNETEEIHLEGVHSLNGQRQPSKPQRAPDPLFDALANACGCKPSELTKNAARAVGFALSQIRDVMPDLTSAEIERRAKNYHGHFPNATITANALSNQWAKCADTPKPSDTTNRFQRKTHEIDHSNGF